MNMPTTSAEEAMIEAAIRGRQALEADAQGADDSSSRAAGARASALPRLPAEPELVAEQVLVYAQEVADALRAGDAAQPLVDNLAFLFAVGEAHVGAEAIRGTRP